MSFGTVPAGPKPTLLTRGGPHILSALYYVLELARLLCRGVASLFVLLTPCLTRHAPTQSTKIPKGTLPSPIWKSVGSYPLKLTVVLDLDETLVFSYPQRSQPRTLHKTAAASRVRRFQVSCDVGRGQRENLIVLLRPGLLEFLNKLSAFSDVVLFSAAVGSYGNRLADILDPAHRLFAQRLFRESTVRTDVCRYVKDLTKLKCDLRRTVMVDNRAFSFVLQPRNGICCKPFRGNAGDRELPSVILPLLEELALLPDVRPTLHSALCMEKWFRSKGLVL